MNFRMHPNNKLITKEMFRMFCESIEKFQTSYKELFKQSVMSIRQTIIDLMLIWKDINNILLYDSMRLYDSVNNSVSSI